MGPKLSRLLRVVASLLAFVVLMVVAVVVVDREEFAAHSIVGAGGLAVDSAGNLYIVDARNCLVSKVTPAGRLSIVAGNGGKGDPVPGPATASPMGTPVAVAVDSSGNIFVSVFYRFYRIGSSKLRSWLVRVTPKGRLSVLAAS